MRDPVCFLDMDGVLADLNGACYRVHDRRDPYTGKVACHA